MPFRREGIKQQVLCYIIFEMLNCCHEGRIRTEVRLQLRGFLLCRKYRSDYMAWFLHVKEAEWLESGEYVMTLKEFFVANPKIALAFSGGVDSAYLLYAALEQGAEVKAYFIKSQFQPEFELEDARRLVSELAERFNRDEESMMCVISLDVLACDTVAANPADRCYYCKQRIFGALLEAAAADGFTVIMDGTNASDEEGDRPGMRALQELQVKSPLRLSGLTKDDVRQQSRKAGLFTWDKPSYACLATRIPTGQTITAEVLKQVEAAETSLETLGFRDFRIRLFHGAARIQLKPDQMELAIVKQREILEQMKPLFAEILLDMEGR